MLVMEISTIVGILMTYILPCIGLGVLEYIICKKAYKFALILPIITFLYFLIMIFSGFSVFMKLTSGIYGIVLGTVVLVSFSSLFITTFMIYLYWKKKKNG